MKLRQKSSHVQRTATMMLAAGVVLAACAGNPAGSPSENGPIKVGMAISNTGTYAKLGPLYTDGAEYYLDMVNEQGGCPVGDIKRKFQLSVHDDQSDPQTGARLIDRFITQDQTNLILGGYGTASVQAASAVAEKNKAIYLNMGAVSASLYDRGFKYFFGSVPRAQDYLNGMVDLALMQDPKPQTVAFIFSNSEFTQELSEKTRVYAEEKGMEVVFFESYPEGATNVSALISKIKASSPDVVFGGTHEADAILIARQAQTAGLSPKLFGLSVGPTTPSFIKTLGDASEGVVGATPWSAQEQKTSELWGTTAEWAKGFREKYGYDADYHTAGAFTHFELLCQAITKAGSATPDDIAKAFRTNEFQALSHEGAFGDDGWSEKSASSVMQIQDGKLVLVWPGAPASKFRYPRE